MSFKRLAILTTALFGTYALTANATTTAPVAATVHNHATDCRAFPAGSWQTLCRKVQLQHPYGASASGDGGWSSPNGYVLVHEITHQGLTMAEKKDYLTAEADNYRTWVTAVQVNMDSIVRVCGNTDGYWAVQFVDEDHRPGGRKLTWKHVVCA